MRKRFDEQMKFGQTSIQNVQIPTKSRDELPPVLRALQWIHSKPELLNKIFEIIEKKITVDLNNGRPGMDLWHILVLGVIRLTLNTNYDRIEYLVHYDKLMRQIMGVESDFQGKFGEGFSQKTIVDNIHFFDEEMLHKINQLIVAAGLEEIGGKKKEKIQAKTDTYVLESNVHFPTDWNLLFDSARKCIEELKKLCTKHEIQGWRKAKDWIKTLKYLMRSYSQTNKSNGKNKEERAKQVAERYIKKAIELTEKIKGSINQLIEKEKSEEFLKIQYFNEMLILHINLFERRVLKGEKIAHEEKIFSIFQDFTRWINKGKTRNQIELGLKLLITTEQNELIIDYKVMKDNVADVSELRELVERLQFIFKEIESLSTDKGFYEKALVEEINQIIPMLVIPKKGKKSKEEQEREGNQDFKKLRKKHSAIESSINCLEKHGLDRCPDKGIEGFERYVGLGVMAYNIHKIGNYLLARDKVKELKREKKEEEEEEKLRRVA